VHPRRLYQLIARALTNTLISAIGLTIVSLGAWMAWPPLGVILFGMTVVLIGETRGGPDDAR